MAFKDRTSITTPNQLINIIEYIIRRRISGTILTRDQTKNRREYGQVRAVEEGHAGQYIEASNAETVTVKKSNKQNPDYIRSTRPSYSALKNRGTESILHVQLFFPIKIAYQFPLRKLTNPNHTLQELFWLTVSCNNCANGNEIHALI